MTRKKIIWFSSFVLFFLPASGQATLTTIGTADYEGGTYNLIYDDDDTGHGGGGLVWLDYSQDNDDWQGQYDWATGLGGSGFTVTLATGYSSDIDWSTGWRLPDTVDGVQLYGNHGDPDNDGIYDYTHGYNLANSEMGHLFAELGNIAKYSTDGVYKPVGWGLQNTGDFNNLHNDWYWSGTVYGGEPAEAWSLQLNSDYVAAYGKTSNMQALAVHEGTVSGDPVPEPATMLLFGTGFAALAGYRRRNK